MKPSDASEQTVFDAARQMADSAEREAYLDGACAGDRDLRQRIAALLQAAARADEFLAGDPLQLGERRVAPPGAAPVSDGPGTVINHYKLLEKLGEGGCGVVYMAEQEEPVRRKVALKVIKLGMDTRQLVARFEAERQALALMDHPNIAKVLDAGATDTGRPYFVMELVGGIKITDYCEQNNLTTRQRLDLFIQVCRAIQHAHQKGVIHRDIKPSNVLVATQDGVPVPKVIDFGIAKATQGKLTDQTVFTAFEQFLGTPAYMSPEQAQVGSLDVDTRSDVYSLGVLLYELLTGKTPFDTKELLAAGLDAMRRTIQEKEPPTPSTRLKQDQVPKAERRKLKAEMDLANALRGDLDWIVMKCLEKDRARRYETANGLAMDIQRHLSNEPVAAGPPGRLYRLQKLVRRNKGAFAAATVILALLVLGVGISWWEAQKAETEAAKSRQVAQFLKDMLAGVGPSKALGRDTIMLKEILDKTAERVGKELTNQPETEMALRQVLARTYGDLGEYKEEEAMAQRILWLARAHYGEEHRETGAALKMLGDAERHVGNYGQAEKLIRAALAIFRKLLSDSSIEVADSLQSLSDVLAFQGKFAEAEPYSRQALAIYTAAKGDASPELVIILNSLAQVLHGLGKDSEAEILCRRALVLERKRSGSEHPSVAAILSGLGTVLYAQGKVEEAETVFREALAMDRKFLGPEHPSLADLLNRLGNLLRLRGKLPEAETMYRQAAEMERHLDGNEHPHTAMALGNLAGVLAAQSKYAEAEPMEREGVTMLRKTLGDSHPQLAEALNGLATTLLAEQKFTEAETPARESLSIYEKRPPDNWLKFRTERVLGAALIGQRKYAEAETLLLTSYTGLTQLEAHGSRNPFLKGASRSAAQGLVELYQATDRPAQAAEWKKKLDEFEQSQATKDSSIPTAAEP